MLLDTNIVSYIYKGDSRAAAYQRHLLGHQWFVSFMTLAEIHRLPLVTHNARHFQGVPGLTVITEP